MAYATERLKIKSLDDQSDCFAGLSKRRIFFRRQGLLWKARLAQLFKWFAVLAVPVMFFVLICALIMGAAVGFNKRYGDEVTLFTLMEFGVLVLAMTASSASYLKSTGRIADHLRNETAGTVDWYTLMTERFWEQIFAITNFVLFIFAFTSLLHPLLHLISITAIYLAFTLNNYLQSQFALNLRGRALKNYAYSRILDLQHWLRAENAPAVVGYSVVIVILTVISAKSEYLSRPLSGAPEISLIPVRLVPVFTDTIKAFAAGVAGYHLLLSTSGYLFGHQAAFGGIIEEHLPQIAQVSGFRTRVEKNVRVRPVILALILVAMFAGWTIVVCWH